MNYLMNFQIKILILSFAMSIIFGLIVIPILKKCKVGQIEREDGPESHLSKQGTPTMGGIIMAIAMVVCSAFLFFQYKASEPSTAMKMIPLVFVTLGFGLVGFVDDFKKLVLKNTDGLKPMYKMFGSMELAIAAYNAGPANVKKYNAIPPFRETKRFVSQIMKDYYYLKAHTDPAIIAYNKSKQKVAEKTIAKVPEKEYAKPVTEDIPKINITPQFVASTPANTKAPIPMEKAMNVGQMDLLDSASDSKIEM